MPPTNRLALFCIAACAPVLIEAAARAEPGLSYAITGHRSSSSFTNLCLIKGQGNQRKSSRKPFQKLIQPVPKSNVSREEKFLQLLLTSVGSVGIFIAILALRSIPPARKSD